MYVYRKDSHGVKFLQLGGHQGEVFMCSWNPALNPADNTHQHQLATGSADGICRLWGLDDVSNEVWNGAQLPGTNANISLRTGLLPHASFMGEKMKDVTSISWSVDGTYLATGCYDGLARVWNCATGELKFLLKEHRGWLIVIFLVLLVSYGV